MIVSVTHPCSQHNPTGGKKMHNKIVQQGIPNFQNAYSTPGSPPKKVRSVHIRISPVEKPFLMHSITGGYIQPTKASQQVL